MKVVIIGAGFAGLSAASRLKKDYIVLEKNSRPGGLCRSEHVNGFTFDYTGHFLHLRNSEAEKFILKAAGKKLRKIQRKAFIYSRGVYTKYPYQANNYGLPPEVIEENLAGFIKAKLAKQKSPGNFKEWVMSTFGEGIAKNFMLPYNSKLWQFPLDRLTIEWMGRFVPSPSINDVLEGILPKGKTGAGYNASFYYPKRGGIETVIKGIYSGVKDNVMLNAGVRRIDLKNRVVYYGGKKIKYKKIISTMPLNSLLKICGDKKLVHASKKLKAASVYSLNVGFKPGRKTGRHWVYVPEEKYPFYRTGFFHEVSRPNAPKGYGSVFAEVSFRKTPPKNIKNRVITGLLKMGVIKSKRDIKVVYPMVLKDAYVIYDKEREKVLPAVVKKLKSAGIVTAGRWGKWEYSSMEDAVLDGFRAAKQAGR